MAKPKTAANSRENRAPGASKPKSTALKAAKPKAAKPKATKSKATKPIAKAQKARASVKNEAKPARASRSLGKNPFDKGNARPMTLLSLDPSARPPAKTATRLPPEPVAKVGSQAEVRKAKAEKKYRARPVTQKPVAAELPASAKKPQAAPFSSMQSDLARRLGVDSKVAAQHKGGALSDEQVSRIEGLLEKLDRLDLSDNQKGLFKAVAKAWDFFTMFGRSMTVDDFGLDPRFEELVDPIFSFLYHKWWRVEATGLENFPADGRALIVANHSGMLPYDGGMIKYAIREHHPAHRDARPLVEDFVYHFPFLGALMARMGGVRACQENAQRLLESDELVVVFPEGVKGIAKLYRYRYQLQRFGRGGFVRLCLRTGAPIIPTAVVGAEEIHPIVARADWLGRPLKVPVVPITPTMPLLGPLGMIPFPTKWYIHFGKPIDLRKYGKAALDDDMLINRITADVRVQIQESIYEQLKKRRSVFFG